jgi:large subunit ribosomal protein L13
MKSYMATPQTAKREWLLVDAQGKTLGRLATELAVVLCGKHKPAYTPHVDTGDFVIVVNAEKVVLTGRKLDQKMYWRHSGHPGGIKGRTARQMLARKPHEVLRKAVKGMLPKNNLGRHMLQKLKIYAGPEHPHQAQQPKAVDL